ncbi:MAG: hypothetical protein D6802_02250 [Ardenticatenia bacterium]|nr:MAG: hypothetical protein D6802_02250 [Ardenticatenia bacterium]
MRNHRIVARIRFWWNLFLLSALFLLFNAPLRAAPAQQRSAPLPLHAYPRPANDNGWGVHFSPGAATFEPVVIEYFVRELQEMGMKWTVILNEGTTPRQDALVDALVAAGIEPILRIYTLYNDPLPTNELQHLVRYYSARGVHYYQLYNEPNLAGEPGGWRPGEAISVDRIVDLWIPAARAVRDAGGYPSTPPLAPGGDYDDLQFWREFLDGVKARGAEDAFFGAWINVHNYGLNHPFAYPEEPINLLGQPVTPEELALYGLTPDQVDVEALNYWRSIDRSTNRPDGGRHKGDTILEDSNAFRKFEAYHYEFVRRFRFEIPVISTEGGWIIGDAQDKRYPPVTVQAQTTWLRQAYEYMLTSAPDYFFAFNPWIVTNYAGNGTTPWFEPHAWYKARCNTNPAEVRQVRGQTLPICGDGDVLPIVYVLKAHPMKHQARRLPDPNRVPIVQAAVVNPARASAPPPRIEEGVLRFDLKTWDAVATLAATTGLPPTQVLERLYDDVSLGTPSIEVATYRVHVLSEAVEVEQWGTTVRLTNITDEIVNIQLAEQVYTLLPHGSLVVQLPTVQYVMVPTRKVIR